MTGELEDLFLRAVEVGRRLGPLNLDEAGRRRVLRQLGAQERDSPDPVEKSLSIAA